VTGRRRALVAAALALAVLAAAVLTGVLTVRSLGDVAIGTDTSYCGWYFRQWSAEFYCQSGH
jgi:hypothetical protein